MADVNRLKKKAAEYEAKRQFERAIAAYEQIVIALGSKVREADVPIFNRLGDLYLRIGQAEHGTVMHEKAVDLYAELGFFNNAIALCNKILRQEPNRASVYYKLGKISAKKGFISDAKQNFLEYSSRMQKSGHMDEAFRALKEFADLCPDQDDVRLSLAEQLLRADKPAEALEQLQLLHQQLRSEGRDAEAAATVGRMRAIDPNVVPREPSAGAKSGRDDLIFLDLDGVPESAKQTARLDGFEPTSLEGEAGVLQLLTPREFGAAQFPDAVEPEREFRTASSYLAGLPVLDDYESTQLDEHSAADLERVVEAGTVAETHAEKQPEPVTEQTPEPPALTEPTGGYPGVEEDAGEEIAVEEIAVAEATFEEATFEEATFEEATFEEATSEKPTDDELGVDELGVDELAVDELAVDEFADTAVEPVQRSEGTAESLPFTSYYESHAEFEPGDSGFPSMPEPVASYDAVESEPATQADYVPEPIEPDAREPEPVSEVAEAVWPDPLEAAASTPETAHASRPDDELVDLGEWLREIEGPRTTRMVADEGEIPPEGEQADFEEMLEKFKQGIAENMDADDHGSHYDLGVAFREMGLLDEAIAQFQRALRGRENRVATYEALGQCFVDKRQYEVATTVLQRALREPGFEDERGLGVLYLLGIANELMSRPGEAARYYQRVFSVDINFRDIADRRNAVAKAGG